WHANGRIPAQMSEQHSPSDAPLAGEGAEIAAHAFAPTARWIERLPFIEPQEHMELLAQGLHARLADRHFFAKTGSKRDAQLRREIVAFQKLHHLFDGSVGGNAPEQRRCVVEQSLHFGLRVGHFDRVENTKKRAEAYPGQMGILKLGIMLIKPAEPLQHGV